MTDDFQNMTVQVEYISTKSILAFFVLAFVLSIPFLVIGSITGIEIMPGLPVAALSTICPMLAALILTYRERRAAGMVTLLKRAFDYKHIKAKLWYLQILLLMPFVMILSFLIIRLRGIPIPAPNIEVLPTLILCVLFFVAALGEELGWSGYVIDPMQKRMGALIASFVLGLIWAVYHYIGLAQVHRSIDWIAWWTLGTVAMRVIMAWIYNNTRKSVFATVLFHMMINVTWQLFPINGSYYDPRITSSILALVTVIIIIFCDPQTLTLKNKLSRS